MIIADDKTIVPETRAEIVFYGWEVYRRTQQIPFPAWGGLDLLKAQSRLWGYVEPYASGREPLGAADLDGIRKATDGLIAAVKQFCDRGADRFVRGQDGSVAA